MTSRGQTPGSAEPRRSPNPAPQAPGSRSPAPRSPRASPRSVLSNVRSPQPPAGQGNVSPRSSFKGDIFANISDAPAQDLAKSYTAQEDVKIYELFKSKPEGVQANQEPFNSQRKALETELGRSHESLRDRYKKYLKYLTDADVRNIKAQIKAGEDNFLQFEKDADEKDKHKKKFKSVIHSDPRPAVPTRRHKGDGAKKNRMPKSMLDEAFDREGKSSIFPGRYAGHRSSMRMLSDIEEEKGDDYGRRFKRASAADEQRHTPRKRYIHRNQPLFDVRDYIPREYVQDTHVTKLDKIDVTPAVHSETYNLNEGLLSFPDVVQIGYDGGDFSFEFVKKPAIKDLMGVLASICQLMNVPAEEAQRIYEGVSLDLDDLKAYIGGHRKLVWTSLEDEALINALADTKAFQRFYPILVGEKGEESVQKRINYLREKKLAKASPKAQPQQ